MENAILVSFGTKDRDTKLTAPNEILKIGKKEYRITSQENLNDLENLEALVANLQISGQAVIFNTFYPFKSNPAKLKLLKKNNISFQFVDFQNLTRNSIDAVIELLQLDSQTRSRKIKEALDLRRSKGATLGNPEIASATGKAIRQRKLKAWINEKNIVARILISFLKEKRDWSFHQIADYLNQKGFRTPMNNQFVAKSVQRLYLSHKELNEVFMHQEVLENLDNPPFTEKNKEKEILIVEGIKEDQVFNQLIQFTITSPIKKKFEVLIRDGYNKNNVFEKVYSAEEKNVEIDLDEHALLPGVHYIHIITEEDDDYQPILNLRISLRNKLKFNPHNLKSIEECLDLIAHEN